MTQVALQTHKKDMMRETPTFAKRKFLYRLSRSDYEQAWGKDYMRPGFGTRVLSTLLRHVPKIGPFKPLGFNNPTAQTEDMYFKRINTTVDEYRVFLDQLRLGTLQLPDLSTAKFSSLSACARSIPRAWMWRLLKVIVEQEPAEKFRDSWTPTIAEL